jgi:hypothetical protein
MICKRCDLNKDVNEFSNGKNFESKVCFHCYNKTPPNSFKQLIRHSFILSSINGLKVVNMFPNELKMIIDDYSFIFNNYVDARNKILNNQVEFDYDFIEVDWSKEQKIELGPLFNFKKRDRCKIPNRITSNRFKLEELGITSIYCIGCLEVKEVSNFTICNGCYIGKCKPCMCKSENKDKRREYEREWRRKQKES